MSAKGVLLAWARSVRALAFWPGAYLVGRAAFARVSEGEGLLTPEGSASLGVIALGALVLVLRILVLFVVPAMAAYRLACAIGAAVRSERASALTRS